MSLGLSVSLLCLLVFACQFFFVSIIFIFEPICVENRMFGFIIFNDFLFFVTLFSQLIFTSKLRLNIRRFSSHIQEVFLLSFPSVCPYVYWSLISCAVSETAVYYLCVCVKLANWCQQKYFHMFYKQSAARYINGDMIQTRTRSRLSLLTHRRSKVINVNKILMCL